MNILNLQQRKWRTHGKPSLFARIWRSIVAKWQEHRHYRDYLRKGYSGKAARILSKDTLP